MIKKIGHFCILAITTLTGCSKQLPEVLSIAQYEKVMEDGISGYFTGIPETARSSLEKELEIMESALIEDLSTVDRNYSMGVTEIRLSMVLNKLNEQELADRYRAIGTNRLNTWFIPKKKMELSEDRAVEVVITFDQGRDLPWHPNK